MGKWLQKFLLETSELPTAILDTLPTVSRVTVPRPAILEKNQANRITQIIQKTPYPTTDILDKVGNEFEERAAIIEYDAGLPRAWAEAFARVCLMQRPASITEEGWQRIIDNTGRLLDNKNHLRDMVRYGWGIPDIFGCHPAAPETRQDVKGLLLLLDKREVISIINEKSIGLRITPSGSTLYYRRPLNPSPQRVMLWELADTGILKHSKIERQ